ncbi:hypothetical protein [Micromonospora sp. BQ11]|uniref:hypothetical protein n=1 Tax=Micromonospora sp. BQ11 TaxID=3452212 RepID=UPI003F8AF622
MEQEVAPARADVTGERGGDPIRRRVAPSAPALARADTGTRGPRKEAACAADISLR